MKTFDSAGANLPNWSLGFDMIPTGRKIYLLWLNAMVPILVFSAFASGLAPSVAVLTEGIGLSIVEALLVGIAFVVMSAWQRDARVGHGAALVIHCLIAVYWLSALQGGTGVLVLLTFYLIAVLYRHHTLYQTNSITASNRIGLGIDTIAVAFITTYYYWWALSMGGPLQSSIKPFFAIWLLASVLCRIYALWFLERIETATHRVSTRNLWVLLIVALCIAIFVGHGLMASLLAVFGAFGLMMTPIVNLLPTIHREQRRSSTLNTTSANTSNATNLVVDGHHLAAVHVFAYSLLAIIVLILLYILFRKRVNTPTENVQQDDAGPQIIRRALQTKDTPFLRTNSPVRLKVQDWMRTQMRGQLNQNSLRPTQTWRMMVREKGDTGDLNSLTQEYEAERYGQPEQKT